MSSIEPMTEEKSAVRNDLSAIFVSLELSRSTWLVTSLSPVGGEKMSKHQVRGGDVAGLLARFCQLQAKCTARTGRPYRLVVIQEAGLDGFWIHRTLQNAGIESHVVDPASIATSRRRRRVKTDGIDGEALVRALLAYKRGEPRVCAMVASLLETAKLNRVEPYAWRRARREGSLQGLTPSKRGRKPAERNPLSAKVHELEVKVARLEKELHTAHTILDVQGKVAGLLGFSLEHGKDC